MQLTIFTPTYNRAQLLHSLYESLCIQRYKNFEWIIIDDGSCDNTKDVVNTFISEGKLDLKYIYQENQGKHRAINKALELAKGKLFFIVDSDDTLTPDALEWVWAEYSKIKEYKDFAGISGLCIDQNGEKIGGGKDFGQIDTDNITFRFKMQIPGDMSEVYRTDVLREFPFPDIEGEKFCPEALIWNRIATHYKMRYIYKGIKVVKYWPDGLSANITNHRHNSPLSSMMFYSELHQSDIPFLQKVKSAINFWRFIPIKHINKVTSMRMWNLYAPICLPLGLIYHLYDKR